MPVLDKPGVEATIRVYLHIESRWEYGDEYIEETPLFFLFLDLHKSSVLRRNDRIPYPPGWDFQPPKKGIFESKT